MRRCFKLRVAAPAAPSKSDYDAIVRRGEIVYLLPRVGVINDRPDRNFEKDILAFPTGFIRALAVAPPFGLVFRVESEMYERVVTLARLHNDVANLAAISTRRSAARNKLLPPEG